MSGSAGFFGRDFLPKNFFFYLVGSPKVGGAGDGKHKKKYGHPNTDLFAEEALDCQNHVKPSAKTWTASF